MVCIKLEPVLFLSINWTLVAIPELVSVIVVSLHIRNYYLKPYNCAIELHEVYLQVLLFVIWNHILLLEGDFRMKNPPPPFCEPLCFFFLSC